jgi:hypothetical protein
VDNEWSIPFFGGITPVVAAFLALPSSLCDLPTERPQKHEDVGTKHGDLVSTLTLINMPY